jgi:1-hydroxycarotenoid 3,4-desaturase
VIVVGAGVGGLAAAIRLQAAGARVTVLERAARVGGKLREVEVGGRALDAGPSVLTMPFHFEQLFAAAGRRMRDHLELTPCDPACRHFFPDGSRLDLFNDPARSREAIRAFAGDKEARGFDRFRAHARTIYETVRGPFMESPVMSITDMLRPSLLWRLPQFLRIDSGRTLWEALGSFFADPRLRQLYGRYATYNGSSPFHCPATLAVIVHVEQEFGIHVVRGGLYRLAEALAEAARAIGVQIETEREVTRVRCAGERVTGVTVDGAERRADAVVANCDAMHLYGRLLEGAAPAAKLSAKLSRCEPSLSAYLLLALADAGDFPLAHHSVFFSRDYRHEFDQLIGQRRPPDDPTVYICAQDRAPGAAAASGAERLLLLTNAPAIDPSRATDWSDEGKRCHERLCATLARSGFALQASAEREVTPREVERLFPSSRGSIYGASSNAKMAAFERPANRVPGFRGLYLAGGSAHPGAGLPMVALSGKIAAEQAAADLGLTRR